MTYEEALAKFGFVPDVSVLDEVRQALKEETRWRRLEEPFNEEDDHSDLLLVLCVQLFAAGQVEDSLNIWRAKQGDFDAFCYIDEQFACGAGVKETKAFLQHTNTPEALAALEYLDLDAQQWSDFSPQKHLAHYQRYFGLSSSDT